jgi:ATP-dependent Lhr-like helicase
MADVLELFAPATRAWFAGAFAAPTLAQAGAWHAITAGRHVLVVAPTGSGKTLAAFLWAIDRLTNERPPDEPLQRCRVLYVSPLKALAVDVERNLRSPLAGIRQTAVRMGLPEPDVRVGVRSGDTPPEDRRRLGRRPPDILITTPESLYLLLTSQAREALRGVRTVIVDEVHAVADTKRGAHLAISLERLDALLPQPAQRIGLSATVRPTDEVGRFLSGGRPVDVVSPKHDKQFELNVVVPVEDLAELGAGSGGADNGPEARSSIWPHVEERVADLVAAHHSTIVFANSRRLAERLTARLNEIAYERAAGEGLPAAGSLVPAQLMAQAGASRGVPYRMLARAHHGSVSKEQRARIEDDLKSGRLPAVVATSSLELGIDMGAVDLVVQVESPPSVASGLQRVGRAGHHVGAVSRGVLFPKYRGDLLQTAVVVERMRRGLIEELAIPRNPLDVLAQQIVAMVALDEWRVDELLAVTRRAYPFATLPQSAFDSVLDLLSGRYPSDDFAELRPRLVWDRVKGTVTGRPGAQRLAVTSGGTIPDRGLFGVYLVGEHATRVGELDEEMVYESRVGDVFTLGASSWRIEDITHDRVLVSAAPGQPGKLPFWHGDTVGRPAELGKAIGAFVRELVGLDDDAARQRVAAAGLDDWATNNLVGYLREQREATGHVPSDQTIVVERFRDELGDWRLVVHSPYGARVHAPWALAVGARLRERYGVEVQAVHSDDGMVFRLPDTYGDTGAVPPPDTELVVVDPDDVEQLVTAEVGSSALFAGRFREAAARALLLPRRDPRRRTPLWQQRQRSAQLLEVASRFGTFPIVLEAVRECLQDVYELPALVDLMRKVAARRVRVVEVETVQPSPFARSLLFGYVATFMYEGDAPLAERRAQALTLDATLLAELLGRAELRELLDSAVVETTEAELSRQAESRRAHGLEGVADLVRTVGPLATSEVRERCTEPSSVGQWLAELETRRRLIRVRVAGEERWAAIEDAGRLRDALGVALPVGIPEAFTEPVADPLGDLVSRYARTHGPFTAAQLAARLGLGTAVVLTVLRVLAAAGRVVEGEFRPGGVGTEWCDAEVLRLLRRRSLAALRREIEPVEQRVLGRFLPVWQHVGSRLTGAAGLIRVIEQLAGAAVPASALERLILPSRIVDYSPAVLDELTVSGDVVWVGQGALPGSDGYVSLHVSDTAELTVPEPDPTFVATEVHTALLDLLRVGGGFFFRQLADAVAQRAGPRDDVEVAQALWDLVWAGLVTNDTLAPLRVVVSGGRGAHRGRPTPVRTRYGRARPIMPGRAGPPTASGRWSLAPIPEPDPTRRAHAAAEAMLDRHGVLTRGAVLAERLTGGFATIYRVLNGFEEAGRCRRGYFVAGLGAAQFALPGAVDRLRAMSADEDSSQTVLLAATDPANPYGAALPWPERADVSQRSRTGSSTVSAAHRPGRKAGAVVVLTGGELVLHVERGGRTLLSWSDDLTALQSAADALALAVREGVLGRLSVERADGTAVVDTPLGQALARAGFHHTPRGLRLRG